MAYHDLVNAGADAVKVGVGPGARLHHSNGNRVWDPSIYRRA